VFQEVGGHLGLFEGVANAECCDLLEEDYAEVLHRQGVDIERLLK